MKWIAIGILELTYTALDMEPFARDLGDDGPPFRWDPERRSLLRAELDAAFFHLYGVRGRTPTTSWIRSRSCGARTRSGTASTVPSG